MDDLRKTISVVAEQTPDAELDEDTLAAVSGGSLVVFAPCTTDSTSAYCKP